MHTADEITALTARDSPVKVRLKRAAFRLEMAQLERCWAVVSASKQGMSVRDIAASVGLGPTRVHQILNAPDAAIVEQALSVLRELGWPGPEVGDAESVGDRLVDEAELLIACVEWLEQLAAGGHPVVNLCPPDPDWHKRNNLVVDHPHVLRVLRRIAGDLDELARARCVADLSTATVDADPLLRLRRRLAAAPIELAKGPHTILQFRKAWDAYERQHLDAGLPAPPNPFRHVD